MNSQNVYYLFSTAAQTVAALVGLLIAGYAFVSAAMDAAARADPTLEEIYDDLRGRYHQELSVLAYVTAAAILSSFVVLYLNGRAPQYLWIPAGVGASCSAASVLGSIRFVISVIDPAKFRKAARRIEAELAPDRVRLEPLATSEDFFRAFVEIERRVRDLFFAYGGNETIAIRQRPPSMREMLQYLKGRHINPTLVDRIDRLSKYRNLVFHGHIEEVDPSMLHEAKAIEVALEMRNAAE